MIPCVGAGITIVDPGRKVETRSGRNGRHRSWTRVSTPSTEGRLLRVYVTGTGTWTKGFGWCISWKSGKREGGVFENDEGKTWFQGHGPQARAAFEVARALT